MELNVTYLVIAIIAGIGALVGLFKPFFGSLGGFGECLRYWLTPDAWSFFKGDYFQDRWSEFKLGFWLLLGGGFGAAVYVLLTKVFG